MPQPWYDSIVRFGLLPRRRNRIFDHGVARSDPVSFRRRSGGRGETCATNQVLYNLTRRGIEFDVVPLCREHGMPIMAYSPIEQGRMLRHPELGKIAKSIGATPA